MTIIDDYQGLMLFLTSAVVTTALRGSSRRILSAVSTTGGSPHRQMSSSSSSSTTATMSLEAIIAKMEEIVQRDEGKRGIKEIIPSSPELLHAARDMLKATSVAIITGFPCLLDYSPPTETDGPLGALAIAKALAVLGKKVVVLTDECNEEVLLACGLASGLHQKYKGLFSMESFPALDQFDFKDEARLTEIAASIDLVVAIERAGPNAENKYLTMRCRDMSHIVAPLDLLLAPSEEALTSATPVLKTKINSIGIGDGGNEVGMGKLYHTIVNSSIPNAKAIACTVPANHLIVCSVSNWGGYALAAATAVMHASTLPQCKAANQELHLQHVHDVINSLLPTNEEEMAKCQAIVEAGARDGLTAKQEMMVDGMPFDESIRVMNELRSIA